MNAPTVAVDPTSRNGTEQVNFPLDSYREAAIHMRRPFTPGAVRFKVQATFKGQDNKLTGGMIVTYIDARLVVERLNLLVPHLWVEEYEPVENGHLRCLLTIDGITRRDIGEGTGKGLYSDALKRAAVKFGVGVSVYAVPKVILDKGDLLKERGRGERVTLVLTDKGEKRCRELYEQWLAEKGTAAFGDPLDHGDVVDGQGDYEAAASGDEPGDPQGSSRLLTDDERKRVIEGIEAAGKTVELVLPAIGVDSTDDLTTADAYEIHELLHGKKGARR